MNLYLTDAELLELRQVLIAQRDGLLNEIAHADLRAAKQELKQRYDVLCGVIDKVDRGQIGQETFA
ncbi:MAG: hypothetical protein ACJ790_12780 [Myxococcaceae bacterium]